MSFGILAAFVLSIACSVHTQSTGILKLWCVFMLVDLQMIPSYSHLQFKHCFTMIGDNTDFGNPSGIKLRPYDLRDPFGFSKKKYKVRKN